MRLWRPTLCFFGLHPTNPKVLIREEAWYVSRAALHTNDGETWNGEAHWIERCPCCGRWHPAPFRESVYLADSPEAKQIHADLRACGLEW